MATIDATSRQGQGHSRDSGDSHRFTRTPRLARQLREVIDALHEAGPVGLTNKQLAQIALRYSSRIAEARRKNFEIKTIRVTESLFRYVLTSEPKTLPFAQPRPKNPAELPLFAEGQG
jgi:hypothetical protein